MNQNIPAGWYDDGNGGERYWDGAQWTDNVRAAGAPSLDKPVADVALPPSSDATQVAPRRVIDSGPAQSAPSPPGGYPPAQPQGYPPAQPQGYPPVQPQGYPGAGYPPAGYPPAGGPGYPGAPGFAPGPGFSGQPSGGSKKPLIFGILGAVVVLAIVAVVLVLTLGGDDDGDGAGDGGDGGGFGNDPAGVVEAYFTNIFDTDLEAACELMSTSYQQESFADTGGTDCASWEDSTLNGTAPSAEVFRELFTNNDAEVTIGDVQENGDTATVTFEVQVNYSGSDATVEEQLGTSGILSGTADMVREDGDWKVDDDNGDFE